MASIIFVDGEFTSHGIRMDLWLSTRDIKHMIFDLLSGAKYNWISPSLGFGYWSLQPFLQHKVKKAVDFMFLFELNWIGYCVRSVALMV
jgi:hypothetical protein